MFVRRFNGEDELHFEQVGGVIHFHYDGKSYFKETYLKLNERERG